MNETNIQEALRAFAARDFRAWQGLAPETSLADVAAVCDVDTTWRASARLGEAHRRAEWLGGTFREYELGIRIWVEPGQHRVLLMDTESPVLVTDLPVLLQTLGTPEAILDSYLGTFCLPESEWAFASRGLTLYVNPETQQLLRLAVYPATSVEDYRRNLRLDLQMKRLPRHNAEETD